MHYRQEPKPYPIRPSALRRFGAEEQTRTEHYHRIHLGLCMGGPKQGEMVSCEKLAMRMAEHPGLGLLDREERNPNRLISYGWYHWSPFGIWRWVPDNLGRRA